MGLAAVPCDLTARAALAGLVARGDGFAVAVHCASSGGGDADAYRRLYVDGVRNLREVVRPGRLILVSSTSVYGQTDGAVVAEDSPAEPVRATGRMLLAAEQEAAAAGGIILRFAGLYGPGRWALLAKFLAGAELAEGEGQRYVNHLHRDDAVAAVVMAAEGRLSAGVFNVADDRPTPVGEIWREFGRFYGRVPPPFAPRDETGRKRGWTSKRVSNAKLRAAGWTPRYPSFRDALPAVAPSIG